MKDKVLKVLSSNWSLIVLCAICVVVMLFCKKSHSSYGACNSINDIAFGICGSYIAGYIFYILTICIPRFRRKSPMKGIFNEYVRYMKDEFSEMLTTVFGSFDAENPVLSEMVKRLPKENSIDGCYIKRVNCQFILIKTEEILSLLKYPISQIDFWEVEDLQELKRLTTLQLKVTTLLKDKLYVKEVENIPWGTEELEGLVSNLLSIYASVSNLYRRLGIEGKFQ